MHVNSTSGKGEYTLLLVLIAAAAVICLYYFTELKVNPAVSVPDIKSSSAVLLDAETGEVLYEENADEAMPPASMSKMMRRSSCWIGRAKERCRGTSK